MQPWLHSRAEQSQADFNSSHVDQYYVSYFPFPLWRDESMHELIVNVAKCAADAVANSGRSIRMGQHVMIRVDIALTHQGPLVRPFVLHMCVHPHVQVLHATQLQPACKMGMHGNVRANFALKCWAALVAAAHSSTSVCSCLRMQYARLSCDGNGVVKLYIVLLIPFSWLHVMPVLNSMVAITPWYPVSTCCRQQ